MIPKEIKVIPKKKVWPTILKDALVNNMDKITAILTSIGLLNAPGGLLLTVSSLTLSLWLKHIDTSDRNTLVELLDEIQKRVKLQEQFWTREENVQRFFQLVDNYLDCRFEQNRKIFKKVIFNFLEGRVQAHDEQDAFFRKAIIEMFPSDIEFLCEIVERDYSSMEIPANFPKDVKAHEDFRINSLVQENPELHRNLAQLIQRGFVINLSAFGGTAYNLTDWGRKFYEYIKQS